MRSVRVSQLLVLAAILVPAALFVGAAAINLNNIEQQVRQEVDSTTIILREHARKVLETEELVLARIADRLEGLSDEQVASPAVTAYLQEIRLPAEQEIAVWVTDATGTIVNGSYPWRRDGSTAGRDYFEKQKEADHGFFVGEAFHGVLINTDVFPVSRRRPSPDASFRGIIYAVLKPGYFVRLFAEASGPDRHTAALVRADGAVLAREPARPDQPYLPPDAPLLKAIANDPAGGRYTSYAAYDDVTRINAYRKVGGFPVYVRWGLDEPVMLHRWFRNLAVFGAVHGAGAVLLTIIAVLALRRARAEEAALRSLRQETEQRLQVEAQLRHTQRLEALGQLAGGIAHDFNNVLQTVTGSAAVIETRAEDPAAVRRFARLIQECGRRGASVTGRLLAFARRSDLHAEAVDAAALFRGLQEILTYTLGRKVVIEIDAPPDLPSAMADPGQLETVLVNMATNARDAMPDGGTLRFSAAVADAVPGLPAGRYIGLTVTDTGSGIPPDVLGRVTEPFFTTKELGKGTGLGLAMARGFAEQSGGVLRISSEVGKGTSVTLWLPAADRVTAPPEAPAPMPPDSAGLRRVLLVDDDAAAGA